MTIELTTSDVPQEDDLAKVRLVLAAVARGLQDTQSIADQSGVSRRHAGYGLNALFVLGWVAEGEDKLSVTPSGQALLAQAAGSAEERAVLRAAIEGNEILRALAPGLLAAAEPTRAALAESIRAASGLSVSTADRRAGTLLSWRRQVVSGG